MSTREGPVFTFSLPGGRLAPLHPCQLRHCWQPYAGCTSDQGPRGAGARDDESAQVSFSVIKLKITSVHGSCQYHT